MASMRIQQCLFGIFCLLSTLSIADGLEMYTTPKILAPCGQNVTLKCDIIAKEEIELKAFYWMEKKDICEFTTQNQSDPDFECMRKSYDTSDGGKVYNFSLTIVNIQPEHKGTYHCKLRSKAGVKNEQTIVRVQKCVGNSSSEVSPTEGFCTFNDVFPEPIIFWNRGNENLTHLAETKVTQNPEGLYTAVSKLKLKKEPSNVSHYNCSLFMLLENEKNETKVEWVRSLNFSGGHKLIGHLFGIMLVMVLGTLLA